MSAHKARRIEQRQRLLEMEAQLQRATLAATLTQWERNRPLVWLGTMGRLTVRALSVPRIRWMLFTGALSRLRRRRR